MTFRLRIVAVLSEAGIKRTRPSLAGRHRYQGFSHDRRQHSHPVFLETPQNVSVGPGDRAVLKCRVENLGTKTVCRLLFSLMAYTLVSGRKGPLHFRPVPLLNAD